MSRSGQFIRGVSSSWLATIATVVYSLLSVPIALRFLSVEEFGLFVLLIQISAYFILLEIGMSAATSRILVDHKDTPDGGRYGSIITTAFIVFSLQALVILAVGVFASPWIIGALGVPTSLVSVATHLLRWLAVTSALAMAFRIYASILYANKRLDLINAFTGGNMLFGLGLLALILSAGLGLAGLVWLFLAQAVVAVTLPIIASHKLGLLPNKGCWGKPSMGQFRELFSFGKDVFLVNIGNQILEASQLIIVTRTMGLTAAATWSVSTKLFTLVYQLVTKIEGTAIVFFAEMMVRRETGKLATRFRQIYQLTAGIAVASLAVVVAVNKEFVSVWADPSLAWSFTLSLLMAAFVFLSAITRCNADLIVFTKKIGSLRYLLFLEATAFVSLALLFGSRFGFYGILGASLSCLILFRVSYTIWRMANYFALPPTTFVWGWLKRSILAALILAPFILTAHWVSALADGEWVQLIVASAWVGLPGLFTLLLVAIPRDVKAEFSFRWRQFSCSAVQ